MISIDYVSMANFDHGENSRNIRRALGHLGATPLAPRHRGRRDRFRLDERRLALMRRCALLDAAWDGSCGEAMRTMP
jgi:hypothetical protein